MSTKINPDTRQRVQDAMWDYLTSFGTLCAADANAELQRIKQHIDPCASRQGASHEIRRAFKLEGYPALPDCNAHEMCDAFADLESDVYEAKEAEMFKGY